MKQRLAGVFASVASITAVAACVGLAGCGGDGGGSSPDGGSLLDTGSAAFCDGTTRTIGTGIVYELAVDGEGRLLVHGARFDGEQTMYVRRYLPDGQLDTSFGVDGQAVPGTRSDGRHMLLRPDGRILVAGAYFDNGEQSPLVIELSPDGQVQPFEYREPGTADSRYAEYITSQGSDYAVIIAGYLYRLLSTGTLDPAFGMMDGRTPVIDYSVGAYADGFVLAFASPFDLSVHRLTYDGKSRGIPAVEFAGLEANRIAGIMTRENAAAIVGTARRESLGMFDLFIARLDAEGLVDTTYGQNGYVLHDLGSGEARDAHELADGAMLVSTGTDVPRTIATPGAEWRARSGGTRTDTRPERAISR